MEVIEVDHIKEVDKLEETNVEVIEVDQLRGTQHRYSPYV